MLRFGTVGVSGTLAMVSVAWVVGLAASGGGVAALSGSGPSSGVTTRVSVGGRRPDRQGLRELGPVGLRACPLRGLRLGRVEPGPRHQQQVRRVRAGPEDSHDLAGVGRSGRRPGQRPEQYPGDLRRRPVRGVHRPRVEPGGGDTNNTEDVVERDRVAHVTRRASVGPGGAQANDHTFGFAGDLCGWPLRRV